VPELPEVEALAQDLSRRLDGRAIMRVDLAAFSALKTFDPPLMSLHGMLVDGVTRHGKFLDIDASGTHLVLHLARAGWVRWRDEVPSLPAKPNSKSPLAARVALDSGAGLDITEAGTRKSLAIYVVRDPRDVEGIARLGPDPLADEFTVDVLGRILCVNRRYAALTGICRGMTLEEVIVVCDIRDLAGHPLTEQDLPEAQVLLEGEEIGQSLLRMRCPADGRQVVLASDCRPVRTADGRVIGAVVIAREVSEEVALAIGVRQVSEGRAPVDRVPVG